VGEGAVDRPAPVLVARALRRLLEAALALERAS
jgi:hypothetical protein